MTGRRISHVEYEELVSSSLTGDLTDAERRRLDAHLDACDACRGSLAAFSDARRIVAGLRHVPVPRDLHARVRAGVEGGSLAGVPWWRRPVVIVAGIGGSLAAVAGAMLALVILGEPPSPVGNATPRPATVAASPTPSPSGTPPQLPSPTPSLTVSPSPDPTEPVETPRPTPVPTAPEPDVYVGHTGEIDNRALVVADGTTDETVAEDSGSPGQPIAAELSPDGQWLAYVARIGESGLHEVRALRIAEGEPSDDPEALPPLDSPIEVGETVVLGQSLSDDPFLKQLFWSSPRGSYLAYTLADPEAGTTDAWIFEPGSGQHSQLTDTGNAYAASWVPGGGAGSSFLWISVGGEQPTSYLQFFHDDAIAPADREPGDPSENAMATVAGVFQPILNPTGQFAIYWDGTMARAGEEGETGPWQFVTGAQPYLAEHRFDGGEGEVGFTRARPVFRDLTVGRDGFTSASITWGPDGDTYAIWDARWTGTPQSGPDEEPYPDRGRVYFSRATDSRGMTRSQAIDAGDVPEDWAVVDVKLAPTGDHLLITAARPLDGVLDAPEADLLLVDRNYDEEADVVEVLRGATDAFWWGPAAFDED